MDAQLDNTGEFRGEKPGHGDDQFEPSPDALGTTKSAGSPTMPPPAPATVEGDGAQAKDPAPDPVVPNLTVTTTKLNGRVAKRFSGDFDACINFLGLRNPKLYPGKKDCPLFQFAELGAIRTPKGSLRNWANVQRVYAVVGDYDDGKVTLDEAADKLERICEAAFYTTPSHTASSPRWRVIARFANPVEPKDLERYALRLNGMLGGILAPETLDFSRGFFFGAIEGQAYQFRYVNPGRF